jgi:hypothetical protein
MPSCGFFFSSIDFLRKFLKFQNCFNLMATRWFVCIVYVTYVLHKNPLKCLFVYWAKVGG